MDGGDLDVFKLRVAMATVCQSISQSRSAANSYDRKESTFEMTGNIKLTLTEIAQLLFSLTLLFWSKEVKDPFYGGRGKGALDVK